MGAEWWLPLASAVRALATDAPMKAPARTLRTDDAGRTHSSFATVEHDRNGAFCIARVSSADHGRELTFGPDGLGSDLDERAFFAA
jgi:hypothetical protein